MNTAIKALIVEREALEERLALARRKAELADLERDLLAERVAEIQAKISQAVSELPADQS